MKATGRQAVIGGVCLVAGLAAGAWIAPASQRPRLLPSAGAIDAGTDLFSVLDDEVMLLSYRTGSLSLTAQRSLPSAPFAVQLTFADGRPAQQCLSSPDLAGLLPRLSTVTARRQAGKTAFPLRLGDLMIADQSALEPAMLEFHASADRQAVAASREGALVEVATPVDTFAQLEAGCPALARP